MLLPTFVFAFNKSGNNSFNRASVVDRLEGHITVDAFRDCLLKNLQLKEQLLNTSQNISVRNSSIIQQQKEEIEYLERIENEKKLQEKERLLKIQKEEEEKNKKKQELDNKKVVKQRKVPAEPSQDDPQSALIIFRYPDGDGRVERRFSKFEKIQVRIFLHKLIKFKFYFKII